jgi:hypothetical protein
MIYARAILGDQLSEEVTQTIVKLYVIQTIAEEPRVLQYEEVKEVISHLNVLLPWVCQNKNACAFHQRPKT